MCESGHSVTFTRIWEFAARQVLLVFGKVLINYLCLGLQSATPRLQFDLVILSDSSSFRGSMNFQTVEGGKKRRSVIPSVPSGLLAARTKHQASHVCTGVHKKQQKVKHIRLGECDKM